MSISPYRDFGLVFLWEHTGDTFFQNTFGILLASVASSALSLFLPFSLHWLRCFSPVNTQHSLCTVLSFSLFWVYYWVLSTSHPHLCYSESIPSLFHLVSASSLCSCFFILIVSVLYKCKVIVAMVFSLYNNVITFPSGGFCFKFVTMFL